MPPSTTTAKARPMKSRPMLGSTGSMMMSSEPATAAVAVARPKASVLIRVGLTPIRRKATWSCENAWIALAVQEPGREGADDDEGRMRQVRNVEHAEGDGDAERHGGIEAA